MEPNDLQSNLDEVTKERDSLQGLIDEMTKAQNTNKNEIEQLKKEVDVLEDFRAQHATCTVDMKALQDETLGHKPTIATLKETNNALESERIELTADLTSKEQELNAAKHTTAAKELEIGLLQLQVLRGSESPEQAIQKEANDALDKEHRRLLFAKRTQDKNIVELESKLKVADKKCWNLTWERNREKKRSDDALFERDKQLKRLQDDRDQYEEDLRNVRFDHASCADKIARADADCQKTSDECIETNTRITTLTSELYKAQREIDNNRSKADSRADLQDSRITTLKSQAKDLRQERDDAQKACFELQIKLTDAEARHTAADNSSKHWEDKFLTTEGRRWALESQVQQHTSRTDEVLKQERKKHESGMSRITATYDITMTALRCQLSRAEEANKTYRQSMIFMKAAQDGLSTALANAQVQRNEIEDPYRRIVSLFRNRASSWQSAPEGSDLRRLWNLPDEEFVLEAYEALWSDCNGARIEEAADTKDEEDA